MLNSLTSLDTIRPAAAPPRAEIDREVYDERGFVVPHYRTFTSILNLFSRTYSYRWDEAISQSQENADAMDRDVFYRRLRQERATPLRHWKWHVDAEADLVNPKAPYSEDRKRVTSILTALVEAIPRLGDMRFYLGSGSVWKGRYGAQLAFHRDHVGGLNLWKVKAHLPVDGDKIQYDWDETPAVYVNTSEIAKYPADLHLLTDRYTALKLGTPQLRRRFVIHRHTVEDAGFFNPFQAGRVAGIGLRDFSYWGWWLRDEVLSWLVDFAEKVGSLGLLLFLYPEGSVEGKAQAEANAKNANNRNALAVPIPKGADRRQVGVEAVTLPTAGVDFLLKVVRDYFEKHIEHLFVGQSMSTGGEGDGQLGGTGRAEFAKDTQFLLFKGDAEGLAETFSVDLLPTFQAFNHLDENWRYYFRFGVPDPGAKDKLEAITKAASLPGKKLEYKADEVRELVGMSKPEDGDETIGGNEPPPGGPMGPGGPGQPPQPGSPPAVPGGLPQGQQGQQPDATGGSPSPDGGEGDSQPVPGMAELVTAMFRAASEGDWQTVRELRMLTADPDGFQAMLEDLDGDDTAQYAWTAGTTKRTGKVKAVGTGEHEGRTLYGKRAEAALRSKPDGAAETPHPARQRAQDLAAQRETARIPAREAYQKALADPGSLRPADLAALEDHLKTLKRDELRQHVEAAGSKTYGRVKAELVDKLLEHVRGPQGGAGGEPKPGEVRTVPTSSLHVDPARFQFKLNTKGPAGVTDELKAVRTWNPDFAGVVSTWVDPADGKEYVVNGHHRHELADRLGVDGLAVRRIDAPDAKTARAKGALINIAEGRGTAVDAAKFMRDMGVGIEDFASHGVPLKAGGLADQAQTLTKLNDRAFARVASGDLDVNKALAVAKHLADPDRQEKLFGLLAKREDEGKDIGPRTVEEMARSMAEAGSVTKTENTLWGPEETTEDTFIQRADLAGHVRAELAKDFTNYSVLASQKRADATASAGNVLAVGQNKIRAAEADQAKNLYDQLSNRKGPISEALNAAAVKLASAKTEPERKHVRSEAAESVRAAIRTEFDRLNGKPAADAGGEGEAVRGPAGPAGGQPAAAPAADPGRGSAEPAGLTGGVEKPRAGPAPLYTPDKQLDIFGNVIRTPRPSPKAEQGSLITPEMEQAERVRLMEQAMGEWKDRSNPEPAGPSAVTPIPLADHTALAGAIHEAAGGLKDWMGQTADENGTREHVSNVHKVQTADLYDALKGRLPAGTTLDQFKRTLVEMNHAGALSLSRIDMPQYAKDQARLQQSEAAHHNATFHVVTVPGDKLKPAAAKHLPPDTSRRTS